MSKLDDSPSTENIKTSPERSTEKPINNNIKERLNLHVKRRLQESAAETSSLNNNNTTTSNNNNNNTEVKVRKQYTKRTEKPNVATIARRPKRTKLKQATGPGTVSQRDTESVGSVASTSTTASAGDDEGSRDGNSQNTDLLHSPREKEKNPDLLGVVLNIKKKALMENPEVSKFLKRLMEALQ